MMVCGLPLSRHVNKKCCLDKGHIDNFGDSDYAEVFSQASEVTRSCLQAAFPSAIIFNLLSTFSGEEEDVVFEELLTLAACRSGPRETPCISPPPTMVMWRPPYWEAQHPKR